VYSAAEEVLGNDRGKAQRRRRYIAESEERLSAFLELEANYYQTSTPVAA
jgi:hypothetical protein